MPNLRAEEAQRKLLKKKTAELLKKVAETNRALNQSNAMSIPIRKATARKSTHISRNPTVVTANGVSKPKTIERRERRKYERRTDVRSSSRTANKFNGVDKQSVSITINNKSPTTSLRKHKLRKNSSTSETINSPVTGKVELIKETVQNIKGSLGLFLKAKKSATSPNDTGRKQVETRSKLNNVEKDVLLEDYYSDDSLLEDNSPPPAETSNNVADGRLTAPTSEDAGSEEGLKLWLDESSEDSVLNGGKANAKPRHNNVQSEEPEDSNKVVAAVTLERLPSGVIDKLSSAGRIKVHLRKAKRGIYRKCGNTVNNDNEDTMPEVSVIDGIEFYSFETEEDLIEYTIQDQKLKLATGIDLCDESEVCAFAQPIIPTKTNDITQIKGWRSKIFAAETTTEGTPKLGEITNFEWLEKLKNSTLESPNKKISNSTIEIPVLETRKPLTPAAAPDLQESDSSVEEEMGAAEQSGNSSDSGQEREKDEEDEIPLKTYGVTKTSEEDVWRFNELYMGSKETMLEVGAPIKTRYGWFQQFGSVYAPVGCSIDPVPTFSPHRPLYKYNSKDLKAVLEVRNKNKEPEELSLAQRGLITPTFAQFAVSAVRLDDQPPVVQTQKTVIKIDETKRPVLRKSPILPRLDSVLKTLPKRISVRQRESKRTLITPPTNKPKVIAIQNPQKMLAILAKRGIQVSVKPSAPSLVSRVSESYSDLDNTAVSEPPKDYVEIAEPPRCDESVDDETPACGQSHCKLGCVCDSIQVRKRKIPHCGKVDCMFNCYCGFTITSKTTGMMHKILSPSIQSCDRGENFNPIISPSTIRTDEGPVKRRRISRPPARLMDDFVCKSAKDLRTLPEHMRNKFHLERRIYTKFDRKVYQRSLTPTKIHKLTSLMTNGDGRTTKNNRIEPPRVPPIRIVNLKGSTYPKVSPVIDNEPPSSSFPIKTLLDKGSVDKKRKVNEIIGKSQHVLPCGTTIVNGKVSLAIPQETNARALLTMGEIGKGKSSLRFIGLRMNTSPHVMHSTEDAQSLGKNLTPEIAKEMILNMNLQQKASLEVNSNDKNNPNTCERYENTSKVEKIVGYVVANDILKNAVSLAKKTEAPVSAPVSFTVAEYVRSDTSSETMNPQFNIYPIVNCNSHVFVGPFDKILPNIFRDLLHENRMKLGVTKTVNENEVGQVVGDLLDCVCQVMEPQKYQTSNISYKVGDGKREINCNDKRFSKYTISGSKIIKYRTPVKRRLGRPPLNRKNELIKGKTGIDPKYLPPDVFNLAHKRKMELNRESVINRNSEKHRERERSRRHGEDVHMKRLGNILDPKNNINWANKYHSKKKVLTNAIKCIRELEVDVNKREQAKMALITKRYNLFRYYRKLISNLPDANRDKALRHLTTMLQQCCQTRENDKLETFESKDQRSNGQSKTPSLSSESYNSSSKTSEQSSSYESEENSNDDIINTNQDEAIDNNETDLIMSVEAESNIDNETPDLDLLMYAEVDDENQPEAKTQETIIENNTFTTTATTADNNLYFKNASNIPQNVVLQFNDAAALSTLLNCQTLPAPVMLVANQSVVNQTESDLELPKIVAIETISEAQFSGYS